MTAVPSLPVSDAVYLDANASAPLLPAAREAMLEAMARPGNPASVHGPGRAARALIEGAREAVADLAGALPDQVVFTSGGTESCALALAGLRRGTGPVLVTAVEHACVLAAEDVETLAVDARGVLDLAALERRLATGPTPSLPMPSLIAVQWANNETGVLQPVAEAARLAAAAGVPLVCDAVQGPGKHAAGPDLAGLGVDAMALSAHKLGGPQGVGALVVRHPERLIPLLRGGGQEKGRRAGTPNLPGIAGFGAAARAVAWMVADGLPVRLAALRDRLEAGAHALCPAVVVHGAGAARLANTSCLGLPGVDQQRQVMALDLAGVAVSAGSACSSGKVAPSHVLIAMGVGEDAARQAVRVSLSWASTDADVEAFLAAWAPLAARAS